MRVWYKSMRIRQHMLNQIAWWAYQQKVQRYNNLPSIHNCKMAATVDSPYKFLWLFAIKCHNGPLFVTLLKGLSVIASVKKNLQNLSEIKKKIPVNHIMFLFFFQKIAYLTEKQLFIRFHSMGPEHCFSPWENFPTFEDKVLCFSFNKTHRNS